MQTNLEKEAILERGIELVKNDYQKDSDEYRAGHKDAIADGDPQGKGIAGSSGHGHTLPDASKVTVGMDGRRFHYFDHSNFDTDSEAGGQYDQEGRNNHAGRKENKNRMIYNEMTPYGPHLVTTDLNPDQYRVGR